MLERHYCPECDQRLGDNTWWCKPCQQRHFEENFDNWTTGFKDIDDFVKETQMAANEYTEYLEWIPFQSFINVIKYDNAEVGTVFSANWSIGPTEVWDPAECQYVAKRPLTKVALLLINDDPHHFLRELRLQFYGRVHNGLMMRLFGVTRENVTGNLMIVAETVEWDLRHYVSHHWAQLSWQKKIAMLHSIACGLDARKNGDQAYRDFHSPSANTTFKSHVEVPVMEFGILDQREPIPVVGYYKFDIIPFFAPEILAEEWKYDPKQDIYSFGMLMWEFASNRPPFYEVKRDREWINQINRGLRPVVRDSTPRCYKELIHRCWALYPEDRPDAAELVRVLSEWIQLETHKGTFEKAEEKRQRRLIERGFDPNPNNMIPPPKVHPQAIYTSRLLKFPVLPSPRNAPRRSYSLDQYTSNSRTDQSTVLSRDNSFFTDERLMQRRTGYPEIEPEQEDPDLSKQYELSIPVDINPDEILNEEEPYRQMNGYHSE